MNNSTIATLVEAGTKITSLLLRTRTGAPSEPPRAPDPADYNPSSRYAGPPAPQPSLIVQPAAATIVDESPPAPKTKEIANSIKAGCIPCSLGHLGTCVGVVNEAVRFARSDGIASPEVIERTNICLDELNAMERVDLRPQMINELNEDDLELANRALEESRAARHTLEGLSSVDDLVDVAAKIQTVRNDIGQTWFRKRLSTMSIDEKKSLEAELEQRIQARNNEDEDGS